MEMFGKYFVCHHVLINSKRNLKFSQFCLSTVIAGGFFKQFEAEAAKRLILIGQLESISDTY